jgi:rSAM/selenodomain-associated transferase 2
MVLSVIVPTLNEAAQLEATLAPLQCARASDIEILVVDGGSADGTRELATALADRVLAVEPGRARQMNAGARAARGEALLFLHADTRLPAGAPAAVAAALGQGAHWGRFDVHISGRHPLLKVIAWFMNARSRLTGIATGDQALFVSRQAFDAVGGFPDQPLMEDIELCARLKRLAPPACLALRVATSGRRWERHGVLRTVALMWWLRARYFLGASPEAIHRAYYRTTHGPR